MISSLEMNTRGAILQGDTKKSSKCLETSTLCWNKTSTQSILVQPYPEGAVLLGVCHCDWCELVIWGGE